MAQINKNFEKLTEFYLFSELARRTGIFQEKNPSAEIINLGIGNTTEALTSTVIKGLMQEVERLGDNLTYTGYGEEQGDFQLREKIARMYKEGGINLDPSEIFINDGAKSDMANISTIFDAKSKIAVQDPVYPVYVDSNVIWGRTGEFKNGAYEGIYYMVCNEENFFLPEPPDVKVDLVFLCSPNNPTGTVMTRARLKKFVDYCRENKAVLIFDAAYAEYIREPHLPRSVYEIPGAKKCAIEINSFSKSAGFSGVRLGWTIVPLECVAEDVKEGKINELWNRRQTTMFNGASNIAQAGGLAVLSTKGNKECRNIIEYYMNNAAILKKGLADKGLTVYGGENAPYVWFKIPEGMTSWEFFDKLLNEANIVGTPGSGFGVHGEGYFRLSSFGHQENILRAVYNIKEKLKL